MDRKVYGMIVATIFIIMVVWLSIQLQISIIDGLGEATVNNNDFQGDQIAGSFHILTQDGEMGEISGSSLDEVGTGCWTNKVPGFSQSEDMAFTIMPMVKANPGCLGNRIKLSIYSRKDDEMKTFIVSKK